MRVLIDTNVLISYMLLTGKEGAVREIIHAFQERRFILLLPEPLLRELIAAVQKKQTLSSRIAPEELEAFITVLKSYAEKVRTIKEPIPSVTRDPKDDYLLAYALVERVDYLVTGDKDLLSLEGQIAGFKIVTPSQFTALL